MNDLRTGGPQQILSLTEKLQGFAGATGQLVRNVESQKKAIETEFDDAYKAEVKNDARLELGRLAAENSADLAKFQSLAESYTSTLVNDADARVREDVGLMAQGLATSYAEQIQKNQITKDKKNADAELVNNYDLSTQDALRLAREGDTLASGEAVLDAYDSIDARVDSGAMLPADGEREKNNLARSLAEQSFMTDIDAAESADAAYGILDDLSEKTPKGWAPDDWQSFLGKAQTEVNRRAKREVADAQKLSDEQEALSLVDRGAAIFENEYPIDPKKTTDQSKYDLEAVNAFYDAEAASWSELPINDQINKNVEFINKTGIIPLNLESRMNAFSRSGAPDQVSVAAEVYGRAQETSPQSIKDLPDETKAILSQVSDAQKSGTDVAIAADAARMAAYGTTSAQREEIKIKTAEFNKDISSTLQDHLDADFDPGMLGDEPDAPPAMQAEYKVGFDRYMLLTNGDSGQAEKLAYQDLKNTWGETRIGGEKRFMKYSPEAVYHINGVDDAWIGEQFEADLVGYPDATIVVDPSTARSKTPEYAVMVPNEKTGIIEPIFDDNNRPLVWQPDFRQTDQYTDMMEAPGIAVEKAKRQRDINKNRKLQTQKNAVNAYMRRSNMDADTSINNLRALGKINESDAEMLRVLYASEI